MMTLFLQTERSKRDFLKGRSYRDEEESEGAVAQKPKIQSSDLVLDAAGSLSTKISDLPSISLPQVMLVELEFRGQTVKSRQSLRKYRSGLQNYSLESSLIHGCL